MGECIISNNPQDTIRTFALSTCVGITAYFPDKKFMAMIHIVLPEASKYETDMDFNSMRFADTAVKMLFNRLGYEYGCSVKDKYKVALYGGIGPIEGDTFKIGERNLHIIKRELTRLNIYYDSSETGGMVSRTLTAHVDTGAVEIIKGSLLSMSNTNP